MNSLERNFIEGAARAMYVQAWAYLEEQTCRYCGLDIANGLPCEDDSGANAPDPGTNHRGRSFASQELMDIAPPTPDYALLEAARLLGRLESVNRMSASAIMAHAARADAEDGPEVPIGQRAAQLDDDGARTFGHYVAMQALGHGVSWFDDHARFELKVPHVEFELED